MSVLLARNAVSGCTKETCPASSSIYGYAPTFDSSVGFIATFAISFLAYYHQSFVWPKWRFYSLIMAFGCLMESLGYIGRLMLHDDPFSEMGFKLNVILLTIAPAFLSAGLYIMLKRLVTFFGPEFSRIAPNAYAYIFVTADIVSIILQGAGGTISAIATEKTFLDQGVNIMIGGLVSQVVTLMIFAGLCVDFYSNARKHRNLQPICRREFAGSLRFKLVVGAMTFSFLCILTRCAYRMAELSEGWGSEIMRKEVDFIIMDSVMCLLAALSLNIFHPGYFFEDPETVELTANLAAENRLKRLTRQTLSREKTRGYSMMPDERFFDLQPPQPTWVGNVTCVRCAVQDDRRSWI